MFIWVIGFLILFRLLKTKTFNEMEPMKTGDQRCTDFLREERIFFLKTTEQKAKHCRNVSYPLKNTQLSVVRRQKQ